MSYIELLNHSDYEILNEYPFTIRRKRDQYKPVETFNHNGYAEIALNGVHYLKHRLIALQFIPNDDPDNKNQVDHINHDRSDYHISNLRWVTSSENQRNRASQKGIKYEYFDDIPDESIVIDFYETRNGMRYFDKNRYFYYYDDENDVDIFYGKIKNDLYRRLHINCNKWGNKYVNTLDVNNKVVAICLTKFKQQYDLI